MSFELSPKQLNAFKTCTARINVLWGAVRSGKTFSSELAWIDYIANAPPGDLLMIGKTDRALKRNIIKPMMALLGSDMQYYPGLGEVRLWGHIIYTVGAHDEGSEAKIRGMTCAGAYGDEMTLWPESFFTMLLSRMSVTGAKFIGTTNPDGPNHWLKENYLDREGLNLKQWTFYLDDNPSLDPQFVRDLKNEYVGLWYKRFIQSLWVLAEGAIYDLFDDPMIIDKCPQAQYYIGAGDYATSSPSAFGLFGVNRMVEPCVWLEHELYYDPAKSNRQLTDAELVRKIQDWVPKKKMPIKWYIDPSAASLKVQMAKSGFWGVLDADNDVVNGIRTQATMLGTGRYKIHRRCVQTIKDYYAYVWDAKAALKGEDKPIKQNDHTKDMERYALHTEFGQGMVNYAHLTQR